MNFKTHKKPTVKDVAKASGLSVGTVSHVLSGKTFVQADTKARVAQAMAKLGYVQNETARLMVSFKGQSRARTGNIGVIFVGMSPHWSANPLVADHMAGVDEVCQKRGFHPLVEFLEEGERPPRCLSSRKVDGLLVKCSRPSGSEGWLPNCQWPAVIMGAAEDSWPLTRFSADDGGAARDLCRHFFEAGHRRIGFLNLDRKHPLLSLRQGGWEGFCREHNIYDQALCFVGPDRGAATEPEESPSPLPPSLLNQLIAASPTALVAANDWTAASLYQSLAQTPFVIPRSLAVAGFDNTPGLCQALSPSLSSYDPGFRQIAREATRHLIDLVQGVYTESPAAGHHLLSGTWHPRGSFGPRQNL